MLEIRSPLLARLAEDWEARRRGRLFPARPDFDVLDLGYILGRLSLVSVEPEPLCFRYRVHATDILWRHGYDLTGKALESHPDPAMREIIRQHFMAVLAQRAPVLQVRR